MFRAALRSLLARKVRLLLTALSIVLGVGFVAGTYVLTDTMTAAFDDIIETGSTGLDVLVRAENAFDAEFQGGTEEREPMRDEPEGTVIAGWAPVRLVEERLGIEIRDHHEATIGGVVLEHLGRLPDEGEEVDVAGVRLAVLAAADAQIQELRVISAPPERRAPSRD